MKPSFDLIISSNGRPAAFNPGLHEYVASLSMREFDPADYVIHESPRATYRISKDDAESDVVKRFLAQQDRLPPQD